jgi:hypothetical protein
MVARRWSAEEEKALAEVKRRLRDQLSNRPQFPEGNFIVFSNVL